MKKIWLVMLAFAVVALMGCESGSYFDPDTKQGRPDAVMRLEASGNDLRVYEFTLQTDQNKRCVFVSGTQKGGLVCFDKRNK